MIAWDLETHPIKPDNLAPKPVCLSICDGEEVHLITADDPEFEKLLEYLLSVETVGHNIAYDLAVVLAHCSPFFITEIFDALENNRVTDTQIREKLIVLGTAGDLKNRYLADGSKKKRNYSLASLEKHYLDIDRGGDKEGDDIWRLHYDKLDGVPLKDWPQEAIEYPKEDATGTWLVWEKQEAFREKNLLTTEHFRTRANFALRLQTCWGCAIDRERVELVKRELAEQFDDSNFPLLIERGILQPAEPIRPYARQVAKACKMLGLPREEIESWEPYRQYLEEKGIKFTGGKAASIKQEPLHALVKEVCAQRGLEVPLTPTKRVSFDNEVQEELSIYDPALMELKERQAIAKLVTTEIPRISHSVVHPRYDILKETGRTSSYGSKKGVPLGKQGNLYPAVNIQQIDPRIRSCYVARPGWVLCSVDFDFLELVSAAQKCLKLFGESRLADVINAGKDPHAMLGGGLAVRYDTPFGSAVEASGLESQDDVYAAFMELKREDREKYDHWRTFAKPTGLGLWGGLGAETFISYAKLTYGVDIEKMAGSHDKAVEMAKDVKKVWLLTYPEAKAYFDWIAGHCKDHEHSTKNDERYCYQSPLGLIRRNCTYTAATNGAALQTPSAEGALEAVWDLSRLCYDPAAQSCLLGCKPIMFIHDQIIAEIPQDEWMHERAAAMTEAMVQAMSRIMTDVKVGAEPVLSLRWSKKAKPVFDSKGRLKIWQPEQEATHEDQRSSIVQGQDSNPA